ncbi:MAG TPA: hypothetical protein PLD57_17040, partial [Aggregatilineales bacterium]|nr:hypothetical protein [Aggregatilineales bacterium]
REKLTTEELAERLEPFFVEAGCDIGREKLIEAVPLVRNRIKTLPDALDFLAFLCKDEITIEDPQNLIQPKMDAQRTIEALRAAYDTLAAMEGFDVEEQERLLRGLAGEMGLKAGQLLGTLREAVTAQKVSPPLFETMAVIGKETVLKRIVAAAELLEKTVEHEN